MFSVSPTQMALATSTPEAFRDGIVCKRDAGSCVIDFLDGTVSELRIFEAPIDSHCFAVGEPVAFHDGAEVIAEKNLWITARLLNSVDSDGVMG
jgi:hypothetical protein